LRLQVAYKSFERRRAQALERAKQSAEGGGSNGFPGSQRIKVDWSFWTQRSETAQEAQGGGGASTGEDGGASSGGSNSHRRVAGLAAAAARAVRMWQSQGKAVRVKGALAATSSASLSGSLDEV
jgi:uncharacterized protein with LGFP repeats